MVRSVIGALSIASPRVVRPSFAQILQFSGVPSPTPSGQITNGIQLTQSMTGPTALLGTSGYPGNLRTLALPVRGYWRGDTPSEFIPAGAYVYNNSPSNFGGVTSGPMIIDGYPVPSGTQVCQFSDFSAGDFFMSDGTNFFFRGCRGRGPNTAPGYFNTAAGAASANYWFTFNDLGGLGSASADFAEVPIKITNAASFTCYRNFISLCTTCIQNNVNNCEVTENFCAQLTNFGGSSHLNGFTMNGGNSNVLYRRNNVVIWKFDSSGRQVIDTDCFSMFQDFGVFSGTGVNADGSTGYKIDNNYFGGTGYCVYEGKNAGSPSNSVNNMIATNNLITTSSYPTGGFNGPVAAEPSYGMLGNAANNNRWADGASAGQLAWGNA